MVPVHGATLELPGDGWLCGAYKFSASMVSDNFCGISSCVGYHGNPCVLDLIFVLFISTYSGTTRPEPICRSNSRISGKV